MATHNMLLANQALKDFYIHGLRNQMNDSNAILAEMERNEESVSGSEIVMALKYGRSGGVGNRADDGDMPTSNPRKKKQARWETKNVFAHIEITDKTIKASRNKVGAFADLLESDLDDAKTDAVDSMARQVFGDGTGVVAAITTSVTSVTITCSGGVDNLSEGQFVEFYDTTLVTPNAGNGSGREISAVNYSANTFVITGLAITVIATDKVVIYGSLNEELTGFGAVFTADNTLYGLLRTTYPFFNPTVSALNGEISEIAIQAQIDEVDKRRGGKTNFLSSSHGVRRSYQNLLVATKQIVDSMNLKGGYTALKYNNMPFTVDKYNPKNTLYGLDMTTWANYCMGDWEWLLDGGGSSLHLMTRKAGWEATLVKYCDLGCSKPGGNFKITGVTEH